MSEGECPGRMSVFIYTDIYGSLGGRSWAGAEVSKLYTDPPAARRPR